ncbi:MAG TPA: thiamine pyrophosphate-binding protein [Mycobacteriales bacterium]|nr:thiamine pyrophosphate-binding protein [Mycobacteriales bacterium]
MTGTGTTTMTGGLALAMMLRAAKAGPMFGMAGFQLLPFYEGVRLLGLEHHLINDERSGAFAADAYARMTGRPGICDATLGPGATNLATALVESLNAGVPLIAITGDAHRGHAGRNMTQEARQVEILRPAVKELLRIETPARIPELVRRAFALATAGRPGPVLLDIPEDVAHAEHDYPDSEFTVDGAVLAVPSRRSRPAVADVAAAAALLAGARRPLILAGGGVHLSGASAVLQRFAERHRIPVAHTLSGKGAIACTHPLSVGLFGRYSRYANELIETSDCLLVVGCKLGEVATRRYQLPRPGTPVIHLDILAEEIGRWLRTDVGLCGDAGAGLADLDAALSPGAAPSGAAPPADASRPVDTAAAPAERAGQPAGSAGRDGYLAEIDGRRAGWARAAADRYRSDERPISLARLVHELNETLPADAVLVSDGGFAAHWTGLLYDTKVPGRSYVTDRGFASIGYGLPGALGAWLGVRSTGGGSAGGRRPVVSVTGDGGLNMSLGDLETARRIGADFTAIVVNNAASGYVKALQHAVFGAGSYQSSDLSEVDYAAVARALGCNGIRVEDPAELATALRAGLATEGVPTVLDVVVTRDPARMLPGIDNRTLTVQAGDRPA